MHTEQGLRQYMMRRSYRPMTQRELQRVLAISPEQRGSFASLLEKMVAEGFIVKTRTHRYKVLERAQLVRGMLQGNMSGFAFLIPEDDSLQDIHIQRHALNGALDRDVVFVRVHRERGRGRRGGRPEGEVVRIIQRGRATLIGTFVAARQVVVPIDKRILVSEIPIPPRGRRELVDQCRVVVKLHENRSGCGVWGEVVQILGQGHDVEIDVLTTICKHRLPLEFPPAVVQEAQVVAQRLESQAGRRDLRSRQIFTIDGEDAKDLDDAVSIESLGTNRVRLGVHIADVSHYVQETSALDREAAARGCSVYLVGRVIPMLPPALSNGVCSLHPQQDRLTITCDMEMDLTDGRVVSYEFYPSVIHSCERLTYGKVRLLLAGEASEELQARYALVCANLQLMGRLAVVRRQRRHQRGALELDIPEASIRLDEQGKVCEIVRRSHTMAEQLIEEFMIAANETVAKHLEEQRIPLLHRVHERPTEEKLRSFYELASSLGYPMQGRPEQVQPQHLQHLLSRVKGMPEEYVIHMMLLRSLQQARYAVECLGHFGLSSAYYAHFTSPIRRYPDLVVHRMLRYSWQENVRGRGVPVELREELAEIALHSSQRERISVEAEREVLDLKKAEFMADKLGEEYEGLLSGVTSFGLFVSLKNTVEGFIHIKNLRDDYYVFHANRCALVGERTKRTFRIGDEVRIAVEAVHCEERKIDFRLLAHQGEVFASTAMSRPSSSPGAVSATWEGGRPRAPHKARGRRKVKAGWRTARTEGGR